MQKWGKTNEGTHYLHFIYDIIDWAPPLDYNL